MAWPDDLEDPMMGAAVPPLPLPVPSVNPSAVSMPTPPQPSKPGWKELAPLAALIPIIARNGGRVGIAAFLQGLSQAQARKDEQARQGYLDQRQAAMDQRQLGLDEQAAARQAATEQYQRDQIANQEALRKQALLKQFGDALGGMDDPEAVRALLDLYGPQADAIGLRRPTLEAYAMQVATPTKLQQRAAAKRVEQIKNQHGAAKWMEEGAKFTYQMPGEPQPITFDELLRRAGVQRDPNAPQAVSSAINPDIPLDRQHAMALVAGNTTLARQIEEAMRRQDAAKSQPVNPQLAAIQAELAQARLDKARSDAQTSGLPPRIQTQVTAKQRGWESQGIVKRTQTMAEAVQFVNSLSPTTVNPADDQALIYAFAKVMDPESVVREGEYATVQKYAQSWAEKFGFDVTRIFSNSPFLTPKARKQLKDTIMSRFKASRGQYENLRRNYAEQINMLTGQQDGDKYLTDYAGGFPPEQPAAPRAPGPNPFRRN